MLARASTSASVNSGASRRCRHASLAGIEVPTPAGAPALPWGIARPPLRLAMVSLSAIKSSALRPIFGRGHNLRDGERRFVP